MRSCAAMAAMLHRSSITTTVEDVATRTGCAGNVSSLGGLLDRAGVRRRFAFKTHRASPALKRVREPVEIEIHNGCREQRERLTDDQAADHRIAERLADFRSGARTQHQRHAAKQGR